MCISSVYVCICIYTDILIVARMSTCTQWLKTSKKVPHARPRHTQAEAARVGGQLSVMAVGKACRRFRLASGDEWQACHREE